MRAALPFLVVAIAAAFGARGLAAQSPPARFFGTVTVDGATPAQGTAVQAYVGDRLCGEGTVRQLGAEIPVGYVVDVKSSAQQEGCGEDGGTVRLKVGGRDAPQSETYVTGGFIRLDLNLSGAVQTPPPGPTPPPFVQPATPAPATSATPAPSSPPASSQPTPNAGASASPGASAAPGPSGSPNASPTPGASGSPGPSASAGASPSASPSPSGSPSPAGSLAGSSTPSPAGTTIIPSPAPDDSGGNTTGIWLGVLAALIALAALAGLVYRSRRGRAIDDGPAV